MHVDYEERGWRAFLSSFVLERVGLIFFWFLDA